MVEIASARLARREFLKASGAALVGLGSLAVGVPLYATQVEPQWVEIQHVDVPLPRLSPTHEGLRLAHLADIHLGPDVSAAYIRQVVALTNAQDPDAVVLTGDFVSRSSQYGAVVSEILGALRAPYGVFAVLGNHDVWVGADEIAACLSEVGISVLRNGRVRIAPQGEPLWLVGIEDSGVLDCAGDGLEPSPWREQMEAARRLVAGIPGNDVVILLVHNPDFVDLVAEMRLDLALAGHTHGGQVRFPGLGAPFIPSCHGQKYAGGWVPGTPPVFVSRGIGLIAPAARFNCRPEISVLRLCQC